MEVTENDCDSQSVYMNLEDLDKKLNQSDDNIYLNTTEISGSTGACVRTKMNNRKMPALCLGFLCVLLLAVIIVLCVKHHKEMYQIQTSNNNLSMERDMLQSKYDIMRIEKEGLMNLSSNLTSAGNQLQSRYDNLKSERDAMQRKLTEIDSCPYKWTRFLSSCYLVLQYPATWERSRNNCIMTGADLVIISSKEEQEFVSALRKNVWIGLTDRDREGQWKWVDNTSLETGYWMNNEPNNAGIHSSSENCAEVQVDPLISNWNDNQCSRQIFGLCEKKIWCSSQ